MTDAFLFTSIQKSDYIHTASDIDYTFLEDGQLLYMLFQETRSKHDWKINFDFPARMYKNMIIHRGYAEAFKQEKEELWQELKAKLETGKYTNVQIAAWSKGSAEAILMAEEYYFQTGKKAYVTTYGGPKIAYTLRTRNYLRRIMFIKEYVQINDFVTWVIPFCHRLNKKKVGEKFNIKKLFNTAYYHCNYDLYV